MHMLGHQPSAGPPPFMYPFFMGGGVPTERPLKQPRVSDSAVIPPDHIPPPLPPPGYRGEAVYERGERMQQQKYMAYVPRPPPAEGAAYYGGRAKGGEGYYGEEFGAGRGVDERDGRSRLKEDYA